MKSWDAIRVASASGATLLGDPPRSGPGPDRVAIDTRRLRPGELFVGLPGGRVDGGALAAEALAAGAWGVLVAPAHARSLGSAGSGAGGAAVLEHEDPLTAMQALASAWREHLGRRGATVVAVTGSTGKTSTKDILAALLRPSLRTLASHENHNTEIGLPLSLLSASEDVEALVLEMAMRGPGQIARLTEIARPDVGVIVNVGPAHLELLGSLEAVAAAKAELIAGLPSGATIVIPAGETLLAPHLRGGVDVVTFGEGGDVHLESSDAGEDGVVVVDRGERMALRPSFGQAHQLRNLLAAVAAARAIGCTPAGAVEVEFSGLRGQRRELRDGVVLIDDCYNANPMSMRAAIADLAASPARRRVAVLGDMLELGEQAGVLHREIGDYAAQMGVALLVTVGPLAAAMAATFPGEVHSVPDAPAAAELLRGILRDGDVVLVKGSRGVGLERVAAALGDPAGEPAGAASGRR